MTRRLVISRTADKDLDEIWLYIATQTSPDAADRVRLDFEHAISNLRDMPGMGHVRSEIPNPKARVWSVHSYLIVYRFTSKTLTVLRVVSGYRNLKRLFRRR